MIARSATSGWTNAGPDTCVHDSATTAKAAGLHAVTSGSPTSGATSATRAAQTWNGMAPNRTATAAVKPKYDSAAIDGLIREAATGPEIAAADSSPTTPATTSARSSRTATARPRSVARPTTVMRIPTTPPPVAAATAVPESVTPSAN